MTADQIDDNSLLKLTATQARKIARDPAQAVWALLRLSALARERGEAAVPGAAAKPDVSTPSAMVAPYLKPSAKKKPRRRGREPGHAGARRSAPVRIDHRVEHALKCCPDCGKKVARRGASRTRVVEDIEATGAAATEHVIPQYYCRRCKKRVEPKVTQALAKSTIGNRALALTGWLHYGLGNSVGQIEEVLRRVFQLPLTGGALVQQWQRLGEILAPWHEEILALARKAGVLHADETGWRVNGRTHWLWCFAAKDATAYVIDASRGAKVLLEFIGESFGGTLVSDFFGAYNKIAADRRQVCLVHLLRELKRVSELDDSEDWRSFAKPLKRLIKDAFALASRQDRDAPDWLSKRKRIKHRFDELCFGDVRGDDACRILKRLLKFERHIFTFLDDPAVPPDNNRAEREIRPGVLARKNSFHNMSDKGAQTQAILMSVHRTLKLRGLDPLGQIIRALEHFILKGNIPPLPGASPPGPAPPPPPDG